MTGLVLLVCAPLAVLLALLVGASAAPVLATRCITRLYPSGSDRRRELAGEAGAMSRRGSVAARVAWLGSILGLAAMEGLPARRAVRRRGGGATAITHVPEFADVLVTIDGGTFRARVKLNAGGTDIDDEHLERLVDDYRKRNGSGGSDDPIGVGYLAG